MLTSQKAEASIEFMIFIGILLVFFVFFMGIIGVKRMDIDESTVYSNARNIINTVANEVNTASRIEGYYREFFIPERLADGETYNITLYPSLRIVKIEWNDGKNIFSYLQTENIQGNFTSGTNKIKRSNGMVLINEG